MRRPFFQSKAWHIEKVALYPSHSVGRSGGSSLYCRKRSSQNSCVPSSMPFTVDGCTISHVLVFVTRHKQCETDVGQLLGPPTLLPPISTYSVSAPPPALCGGLWNVLPSKHYSWPWSDLPRCPVYAIYCRRLHYQPCPCLCHAPQAM